MDQSRMKPDDLPERTERPRVVIRNPDHVLDSHAEWFGRVMRWAFYPEDLRSKTPLQSPETFAPWLEEVREDEQISPQALESLSNLYQELRRTAEELIALSTSTGKPEIGKFDYFVDLYDEFNHKMRRLGLDCVISDTGTDPQTGFRSRQVLFSDLERELERRNRRGRPFCMAYMKVDFFDAIIESMGREKALDLIRRVSEILKVCMRTYDDAYRYGPGEIVWALKHSDLAGGMRAIERLRRLLEDEDIRVTVNGKSVYFTMSYIVSEPVPGDILPEILEQMRGDLEKFSDEPDISLQHKEVSRLQLYVGESKTSAPQTDDSPSARS